MANTNLDTVYQSVYDPIATIGRRSNAFNWWTSRMVEGRWEPYPANRLIQQRASVRTNHFESVGHLSKADIVWTAAIAANVQLEHRSHCTMQRRDPFLEDLMEVGLYDRMQGETRNAAEELSMRYTSAMTSAIMDHVDTGGKGVLNQQIH